MRNKIEHAEKKRVEEERREEAEKERRGSEREKRQRNREEAEKESRGRDNRIDMIAKETVASTRPLMKQILTQVLVHH
tara:strand:- start:563 stop:796 length:234 start_codon:yes stop_codon:yes gene_type:complete